MLEGEEDDEAAGSAAVAAAGASAGAPGKAKAAAAGKARAQAEAEAAAEAEAEAERSGGKAKVDDLWAELNAPTASSAPKRTAPVDDLWAQMNAAAAPKKPQPARAAAQPPTAGAPTAAPAGGAAGAGAGAAAVRYSVPGVCPGKREGYVTVSEVKDFVGERHVVSREVRIGSREELALRAVAAGGFPLGTPLPEPEAASKPAAADGSIASLLAAVRPGGLPPSAPAAGSVGSGLRAAHALAAVRALTGGAGPKPPGGLGPAVGGAAGAGGMSALLARIDKPKKMSTMEKSALDWGKFKQSVGAEEVEAMETFAQDGYLERKAFLARMDERQAANAREVRRKRMGVKD